MYPVTDVVAMLLETPFRGWNSDTKNDLLKVGKPIPILSALAPDKKLSKVFCRSFNSKIILLAMFVVGGSSDKVGDDNCGIFLGLIELISQYDPLLAEHVNNVKQSYNNDKVISYFSPIIQNELVIILGQQVKDEILNRINKSKYFSILFDCSPDVSHQEQLTEIIRYVHIDNGEVSIEESFIDFIISHEKTGLGLADEISSKLKEDGLNIKDCRGQGFDNGANMAGVHNGVQIHIISKNDLAIFVPCAAHSLNLIGVHAAQTSPTIITFFGVIQKLFTYFSRSLSRWEKIKNILKIILKSHCETRWSTKKQAVSVLKNNIKGVYEVLKRFSEDSKLNNDTKVGAKHLLYQINLKFVCLLNLLYLVLNQIDYVNIALQTKDQIIDVAVKIMNGLIKSIQEIRENSFQKGLCEAKDMAKSLNISSEFTNKR
ncbi:uncharacterized protein LOC132926113 [Rhopalosiphum padi]|uniref:uncharacterized protein LOC132926113 n=1 Tax=Rhopalosiphum padi TaxID=40932 RepID=UPI00298DCC54|nr:uncharacterized protein LOC132926113 [Rhopalosiphum padi]